MTAASRPATALPLVWVLSFGITGCTSVIQQADLSFEPLVSKPAYGPGDGPVVQVDEAHSNFHTIEGRYAPFAKLLRRDGWEVVSLAEPATAETLTRGSVYVIANALTEDDRWKLPTAPAFTRSEIAAIRDWVEAGGSLLLIADHMPFPGAVEDLAAAFGFFLGNGFLFDASGESRLAFTRENGLVDHAILEGRDARERIESVRTFTGQAFRATGDVEPLLVAPAGSTLRLPIEAWEFGESTPAVRADGMLQGAVRRFGEGRIAVFGEAAMFTAQEQIREDRRTLMGMNHPDAAQNGQFLLNVMHWLSGLIE